MPAVSHSLRTASWVKKSRRGQRSGNGARSGNFRTNSCTFLTENIGLLIQMLSILILPLNSALNFDFFKGKFFDEKKIAPTD